MGNFLQRNRSSLDYPLKWTKHCVLFVNGDDNADANSDITFDIW